MGSEAWQEEAGNWTGGFWPGILWTAFSWTGNPRCRSLALHYCELLAARRTFPFHDLGFLFLPSCALGFDLTAERRLRDWALEAAEVLLSLYRNPPGLVCLRPSDGAHLYAAVDTMMNLPLLLWAFRRTGRCEFLEAALSHANTTANVLVREDGSTWHGARFASPSLSGEAASCPLEWRGTWQGSADDSCWSRGQAWAIAGYAELAFQFQCPAAELLLDRLLWYWERQAGYGRVPSWDFAETLPGPLDSSAAAIAACGLLSAAPPEGRCYRWGEQLLRNLLRSHLGSPAAGPGILADGSYHVPRSLGVSTSLVWGDYYFLRALDAWWKAQTPEGPG